MSATRFPTYFLSHGGGPWPYMKGPMRENFGWLEQSLQDLPRQLPERPRAVLVVTGHWEEDAYSVSSSPAPGMVFDYYGFPEYLYHIQYPAPGSPALAEHVRGLLSDAGLPAGADAERGFDHGTFSLMQPIYPDADMPIVQLSLRHGYDPDEHWRAGQALAPLRDEGILIVGSGLSYHNLSMFGPAGAVPALQFDGWLRQALAAAPAARREALMHWAQAPSARQAHPREDHLMPLMVALGAAQDDPAVCVYGERFMGAAASSFRFGADRTPTAFDRLAA
ncbi:DODA-type extradiol aromatic ring-opening family dioxygenase [Oleiagrimonas soli]|uniref:Aromatic ring-cleaving dioxygenase n=1 Tax=Oleiagrimonas soli TaxID=1543381 RepID=A0A099CZW7_9GAMM|nr:class III extradiol ring-cleavage dioxygenase [Oleiagrimonas soli]KGI79261.1 aromatic ring-cleaving dioxygenase [Oleiagrimonas soli]MBB6184841.1 aromatic ring-opening dioxygenase catalytic subunit (LigB family) [Oleiagrimonas soli]